MLFVDSTGRLFARPPTSGDATLHRGSTVIQLEQEVQDGDSLVLVSRSPSRPLAAIRCTVARAQGAARQAWRVAGVDSSLEAFLVPPGAVAELLHADRAFQGAPFELARLPGGALELRPLALRLRTTDGEIDPLPLVAGTFAWAYTGDGLRGRCDAFRIQAW